MYMYAVVSVIKVLVKSQEGRGIYFFCEGAYQSWPHARCAGSSPAAFASVFSSPEPFLCVACHFTPQKKEIAALKSTVSSRITELSSLKSELSLLQGSVHS